MNITQDKKKIVRTIKLLLIMLVVAGIVLITWLVGRYGVSQCGEDKGSIYGPVVCHHASK